MNNQMQEIFDRVATHLLTQNKKSMNELKCAYRGKNGTSCAVGCLISNQAYSQKLENNRVTHPLVLTALQKSGWKVGDAREPVVALLAEIQVIHDGIDPDGWKEELAYTAQNFNLNTNVLSNFQ